MNIVEITRTISGDDYDNVSARAVLADGDDPVKVAVELEDTLQKSLEAIKNRRNMAWEVNREASETISLLSDAIEYAKSKRSEIPF